MYSNFNDKEIMPRLSTHMLTLGVENAGLIHNYHNGIRENCVLR